MTDRDFFAAAALAGYCANPNLPERLEDLKAFCAFADADEMIRERPKNLLPIKPPPTLTAEEQGAVRFAAASLESRFEQGGDQWDTEVAATLYKLLERLTGTSSGT